jgi:MFS family permease
MVSYRSLRRLGRFDVLVLTSALWFLAKFLRYAFPPLFDSLRDAFGVSNATLGTAFTGFMLAYAAMQFPSGLLADRFGSVRVIAAGVLVTVGAAFTLLADWPFVVLVAAMVVMGASTGIHKTVAVRLLSRTYPARTGRVLGVFDTFGTFGGVAAPTAVVVFVALPGVFGAGWRSIFLVAGLFGLAAVALFVDRAPARFGDEGLRDGPRAPESTADDAPAGLRQYAALFRDRRFAAFVAVTILFSFAYNGMVAFLPLFLTEVASLSAAAASGVYSALFAASFVQLLSGEASDRLGEIPVIVAALALAAAALLALLALSGRAPAVVVGATVVCLGLGAHGFRPVRGAYLMSMVPDSIAGGGFGAVRALLMGAGALAPAVVGYLSDAAGFAAAFQLLAGSLVAATVLAGGLWALDGE